MTLRNSILFLFITIAITACTAKAQKKKYSITTYFISFDSPSNSMGKEGQQFKYSYEEYNADSNLIYQELYASPNSYGDMWGKMMEKTQYSYKGKEKTKAEREFGIAYPESELGRGKGKESYTYEYKDGQLIKWLVDGKLFHKYQYDTNQNLVGERIFYPSDISEFDSFVYSNGVKVKTIIFSADSIFRVDSFFYNENNRLKEKFSYDKGEKIAHTLYVRNDKGKVIEEKWREPFKGWRMRNNGDIIEDEFYQTNKYYYDDEGHQIKTEFYEVGKLMTVYEFKYK